MRAERGQNQPAVTSCHIVEHRAEALSQPQATRLKGPQRPGDRPVGGRTKVARQDHGDQHLRAAQHPPGDPEDIGRDERIDGE